MYPRKDRKDARRQVRGRVRGRVEGTPERPRLAVYRSLKHIYVQAIDDGAGKTIAAASTADKECRAQLAGHGGNVAAAQVVGKAIAARLLAAGVKLAVFDRGGYRYHGRIKALADAAREGGLQF